MPDPVSFNTGTHTAIDHIALTKSDVAVHANPMLRGLYVGGTGDVAIKTHPDGQVVVYKAVPVGTFMPVQVYQLRSTGTTATDIVGLA